MTPIRVEIENLADVDAALADMAADLRFKAVRSGLRQAAKPIAQAMQRLAPQGETGALRQSINIISLRERQAERLGGTLAELRQTDPDLVTMIIGPNKRVGGRTRGWLAHIIEFGAKPHRIRTQFGRRLRIGRDVVSGELRHPGIRAQPFIEPAAEGTEAAQQTAFFQGLSKHLTTLARKRAKALA